MNLRLVASRTLLIGSVALACVTGTRWAPHSPTSMALECLGLAMLLFGAFGRVWCAVHIAGRKNKDLVAVGPFSTMRNPLYFFSMFAFTGAGLCFDSISLGALFLGVFGVRRLLRARTPVPSQDEPLCTGSGSHRGDSCVQARAGRGGADAACVHCRARRRVRAPDRAAAFIDHALLNRRAGNDHRFRTRLDLAKNALGGVGHRTILESSRTAAGKRVGR